MRILNDDQVPRGRGSAVDVNRLKYEFLIPQRIIAHVPQEQLAFAAVEGHHCGQDVVAMNAGIDPRDAQNPAVYVGFRARPAVPPADLREAHGDNITRNQGAVLRPGRGDVKPVRIDSVPDRQVAAVCVIPVHPAQRTADPAKVFKDCGPMSFVNHLFENRAVSPVLL